MSRVQRPVIPRVLGKDKMGYSSLSFFFFTRQVTNQRGDDVPRAHTLLGLAVAFDLLYPNFEPEFRLEIAQKLRDETFRFTERVRKGAGWGRQYMHNHLLTCQTALLVSAVALQPHFSHEVLQWQYLAREPLERTLLLLRHVVDGSDGEGVGYSTYSTRSLFTYILLVKRHFEVDHTKHPWLQAHFRFLLATTLPGHGGSVGIADSPPTWFYGPEAQLHFLDRFVLQNGEPNWLAAQIRRRRLQTTTDSHVADQRWTMLIHEFLWYAPHIGYRQPEQADNAKLAVLSDWGVATYGGGSPLGNTFLSLKSGFLHGRAIYQVAHEKSYPWINGWSSFNSGHEHPDQGSFVFYPHGQPFVTEAFYGPKNSFLNNVWLFQHNVPGLKSCGGPYLQGQLGECTRWLKWREQQVGNMAGEVLAAEHQDNMVFVAGETAKAYPSWLFVESTMRSLFLLNPETLVIIDHIQLGDHSPTQRGNAFFNNLYSPFSVEPPEGLSTYSTSALVNDGANVIEWTSDIDEVQRSMTYAETGTFSQPDVALKRGGHNSSFYLNVSFPLREKGMTRVAWLLTSTQSGKRSLKFLSTSNIGVDLLASVGSKSYRISLATDHSNLHKRYAWHFHGSLAQVHTNGEVTRFGLRKLQSRAVANLGSLAALKRAVPWSAKTEVLAMFSLITLVIVIVALSALRWLHKPRHVWVIVTILTNWFCLLLLVGMGNVLNYMDSGRGLSLSVSESSDNPVDRPPSILLTGLPNGGHDILSNLFLNHSDVHYLNVRRSLLLPPTSTGDLSELLHPCVWTSRQLASKSMTGAWLQSTFRNPILHFKHLMDNPQHQADENRPTAKASPDVLLHLNVNPSLRLVLGDDAGSWMLKANWFSSVLNQQSPKFLLLVQDPRRWVANVLQSNTLDQTSSVSLRDQLRRLVEAGVGSCDVDDPCSVEFLSLLRLASVESQRPDPALHKLLATVWTAYTGAALCLGEQLWLSQQQAVRVEDIIARPENVAAGVFEFVGLPVTPAVQHRIQLVTQSGLFPFQKMVEPWKLEIKDILPTVKLAAVERICAPVMHKLGYPTYTAGRNIPMNDINHKL